MKKQNLVSIIIFFSILLTPILTFNFKPDQPSLIDNRKLTDFPSLTQSTSLFTAVKEARSYFMDRIGLRAQMITAKALMEDKLFGVLAHPTYTNGKAGHVFLKIGPQLDDYDYLSDFVGFVVKLQTYCQDRGVDFLFSLEPNKQIVYRQYLPQGVNYKNDRVAYLLKQLTDNNIKYVYTAPALIEASKTMQVYNEKYDAGHWNDNGAFIGISIMLQNLKKAYPSLQLPVLADYTKTTVLHTSLPVSYFPIEEENTIYHLRNRRAFWMETYNDEIRTNKTGWYFSHYVNPSLPDCPKILVFMGSYFQYKEKFFTQSFAETTFVHSYLNVQDIAYYFNIFQPDIVLFQTADYATTNTYYPRHLINNANYNPAYCLFRNLPAVDFAVLPDDAWQIPLETAENSRNELTSFSLDISGSEIAYAYAEIEGQIYDFEVVSSGGKQTINLTLSKEIVLAAEDKRVILISADKKKQQIITL